MLCFILKNQSINSVTTASLEVQLAARDREVGVEIIYFFALDDLAFLNTSVLLKNIKYKIQEGQIL